MFVTMICPNCGGSAQIEAGRSAMCPYCASELNAANTDQGFAFAADVQYAQNAAQNTQFAPPPAQLPSAYAGQQISPVRYAQPERQYSQAELAAARKKRSQWHLMNTAMFLIQAAVLTGAVCLSDYVSDYGIPAMLGWLLSLPVCGALSALMRPDEAYIEKKPMFRSKLLQGIMHFLVSLPASAVLGGMMYAILRVFTEIF